MELVIYVDRLKEGQEECFEGTVSSDFLGNDPQFEPLVFLSGKAYVAGEHLMIKLKAKAGAYIPCSICNEPVLVNLELQDFYHAEDLKEIPSVFNFSSLVREDLLLQLPQFAECGGSCPERETLKHILKREETSKPSDVQFPFSHL